MTPDPADIPELMLDPAEWKLLFSQINAEDETISFLLKAHLFAEYHMDRLLADYLGEKREPLDRIDLRFAQKLSLIDSFALLSEKSIRSLHALNKLRNRCVHTFNTQPTTEDMKEIGCEVIPKHDSLKTVPEFLKAYMAFLFGWFSAAKHDLKQRREG